MHAVKIYLVGRGVDIWRHLCRRCLEAIKTEGWETRVEKDPPKENPILSCDGSACLAERRAVAA